MSSAGIGGPQSESVTDVVIVGGGPAGLTAAVALATAGIETVLVAPPHRPDTRTTALLAGSVDALDRLGAWGQAHAAAAPLDAIRLIDDRGGLLRAPEVLFRADEIGLPGFGYNIPNPALVAALEACATRYPMLARIDATVVGIETTPDHVLITDEAGHRLRARLVIGADGRHSLCRKAAGIEARAWHYPQTAITANLRHARPHRQVSTEFHTASGPFTLVPLPGRASSLVWVVAPEEATRLMELTETEFAKAVERQAHSFLGAMDLVSGRGAFPIAGLAARPLAARRTALIGEAAHVIPPIGAQGFNLGLRDALAIADLAAAALRAGDDPGGEPTLQRYRRLRGPDVHSRTLAVDLLNRSLLNSFLPLQGLRGLGLGLVNGLGPLRRALMREGVGPAPGSPSRSPAS